MQTTSSASVGGVAIMNVICSTVTAVGNRWDGHAPANPPLARSCKRSVDRLAEPGSSAHVVLIERGECRWIVGVHQRLSRASRACIGGFADGRLLGGDGIDRRRRRNGCRGRRHAVVGPSPSPLQPPTKSATARPAPTIELVAVITPSLRYAPSRSALAVAVLETVRPLINGNHGLTDAVTTTVTRLPDTDTDCNVPPARDTNEPAAAAAVAWAWAGFADTVPSRSRSPSRALAPARAASMAIDEHSRSAARMRAESTRMPTPATRSTENSTMKAAR